MEVVVFEKVANLQKIYCLYFNQKALLSIDLNFMTEMLINGFGKHIAIIYQEMNDFEKVQNSHTEVHSNILLIDNVFNIFTHNTNDNNFERQFDIEKKIIEKGQK